jgi:predicted metal-dependent phosphoesterase TrpH
LLELKDDIIGVWRMKINLDLHIHTNHSQDGFSNIDTVVNRVKEQGLQGYAITDHDSIAGIPEALEKKKGLIVIPAVEISARGAHVIALEPNQIIPPFLSLPETLDRIHEQGATAILAHPFGLPRSWVNMKQIEKMSFDAIEVANSAQIPYGLICKHNQKLADHLGLPVTGGSDSHIPETIGKAFTIIESQSTEIEDIVKAIKKGNTICVGKGVKISSRLKLFWLKNSRFLRK